jgi:hypothetical protein
MPVVSKPNTYSAGTTAVAAQVNANEDALYNAINGNLDNDNIKASAGIVDSKLATISTGGKVTTAALSGTITNAISTTNISCTTLTATNISGSFVSTNAAIQKDYDLSTVSGSWTVSGLTFAPSKVICFSAVENGASFSSCFAISSSNLQYGIRLDSNRTTANISSIAQLFDANGNQAAFLGTWRNDGITITWVKTGTPAGTAYLSFLFSQ